MTKKELVNELIDSLINHPEDWKRAFLTLEHKTGLELWDENCDYLDFFINQTPYVYSPEKLYFPIIDRYKLRKAMVTWKKSHPAEPPVVGKRIETIWKGKDD